MYRFPEKLVTRVNMDGHTDTIHRPAFGGTPKLFT